MDEYEELERPYFEMTYLDDSSTKHITRLVDSQDVDFYKERFNVIDCNYVSNF